MRALKGLSLGFLAAAVCLHAGSAASQPLTYRLVEIADPAGGNDSCANRLADRGDVVGTYVVGGHARGYLLRDGVSIDLGELGGGSTSAEDINNHGQVVGASQNTTFATEAFLWQDGTMTGLGQLVPAARQSHASAINNHGQIVGFAAIVPGGDVTVHAFLRENGVMTDLGTVPGGFDSQAKDLNERGQIVGFAINQQNQLRATLWENGNLTDLGTLGGSTAQATAINDRGQIVGVSSTAANAIRAFLFDGTMTDLGTLSGGLSSSAFGINARGDVVGSAITGDFHSRAVLWRDGTIHDLTGLVVNPSFLELQQAKDINAGGTIIGCGQGFGSDGVLVNRGFLLIPQ